MAGASAAFCHDSIMTPADTIKQRLQLGHYQGMSDAVRKDLQNEGPVGLYRSFPITLLTNLPYGKKRRNRVQCAPGNYKHYVSRECCRYGHGDDQ